MNSAVRLEAKKLSNRNTAIIFAMFMAILLMQLAFISQIDILDDEGNPHSGIAGWKILKTRTVEGTVTTDFLFDLREHYQNSVDKKFVEGDVDTERELGLRLTFPEAQLYSALNLPYQGVASTMYTDFNLTDAQIMGFYDNRREGIVRYLSLPSNGFAYTDAQIGRIADKMAEDKTPFIYKYSMGWQYLNLYLSWTLWMFFILLAFLLPDMFSKNNLKGIDQIALSTKESRRKLVGHKVMAACFASTAAYGAYLGIMLVFAICVFTLHGWDASVQIGTMCIYPLNMLQRTLVYVLLGYLATIAVAHGILLLSMLFRRGIVVLILSAAYFWLVNTYKMSIDGTVQRLLVFMPQNFVNNAMDISRIYFVGNAMFPYACIAALLCFVYIAACRGAMGLMIKRYYLH